MDSSLGRGYRELLHRSNRNRMSREVSLRLLWDGAALKVYRESH